MQILSARGKLSLSALTLLASLAACVPTASSITIRDAWARPATAGMDMSAAEMQATAEPGMDMTPEAMPGMDRSTGATSAVYMTIDNTGGADDALAGISVAQDIAGATELHQTTVENDVARMSPVDRLVIPANGSVTLQPGGYHIMLMDLRRTLAEGDTVTVTLRFESGTSLDVQAEVRAAP